jgi:hypothetical protein
MTDTTTNPRLFSRDPAERRAFREELGAGIGRFIPPELRSRFQFLAEMTPSAAVERAGSAARSAVQPGLTAGERIGNVGTMLSETAGVAAPFAVATRAAMPAAEAAQEAFLGFSVPARAAAETAFERLNQPGPMPEVLYSNPRFEEMIAALGRGARADRERVPREAREANDAIRADIGLPPLNPPPRPADPVPGRLRRIWKFLVEMLQTFLAKALSVFVTLTHKVVAPLRLLRVQMAPHLFWNLRFQSNSVVRELAKIFKNV